MQLIPSFPETFRSSARDGLITGLQNAYAKLGKLEDKRFLIVHVCTVESSLSKLHLQTCVFQDRKSVV